VSAELLTLLGAILGGGVVTAIVNNIFQKKKVSADAESVHIQNALAVVQPLREVIGDMQETMANLRGEIQEIRDQNIELKTDLRKARQEIGVLQRRERASIAAQTALATWATLAMKEASVQGVQLPPPPELPDPRLERTRASDRDPTLLDREDFPL
jgi:TolA-binding protein